MFWKYIYIFYLFGIFATPSPAYSIVSFKLLKRHFFYCYYTAKIGNNFIIIDTFIQVSIHIDTCLICKQEANKELFYLNTQEIPDH